MKKPVLLLAVFLCGILNDVSAGVNDRLRRWLAMPESERGSIREWIFACKAITKAEAEEARDIIMADWQAKRMERFNRIWREKVIRQDTMAMRFLFKVYGEKPADGRSLYISLHGGGGCPAEINDQQWQNQIKLYQPEEGVYIAPRSVENLSDMWHRPYLNAFFRELIQSAVAVYGVNPDKVYLTGYSAGGDGLYRMAPRMADYWAAALMCAGHPGDSSPLSLRNLPFGLWVGLYDKAYNRNALALKYGITLEALHSADPDGYITNVCTPETGHWMNRADTAAFSWMAQFRRSLTPRKVVWRQDTLCNEQSLYWVSVPKDKMRGNELVVVRRSGNDFLIERCYSDELVLLLNDSMIDYSRPVTVRYGDRVVFSGKVRRTIADLYAALMRRGDRSFFFPTALRVRLSKD